MSRPSTCQRLTDSAPQVRVVDGKIILDVNSLQIDRTARDAHSTENVEYIEENPLDRRINSRTYSKHVISAKWDDTSCELFYKGLSQWGTDFEILSKLFPGRNRKQIKNKFLIEERRNPALIARALRSRTKMDVQEYARIAEKPVRSVLELESELSDLRERYTEQRNQALLQSRELTDRQEKSGDSANMTRPPHPRSRAVGLDDGVEILGSIEEIEAQEELRLAASNAEED